MCVCGGLPVVIGMPIHIRYSLVAANTLKKSTLRKYKDSKHRPGATAAPFEWLHIDCRVQLLFLPSSPQRYNHDDGRTSAKLRDALVSVGGSGSGRGVRTRMQTCTITHVRACDQDAAVGMHYHNETSSDVLR